LNVLKQEHIIGKDSEGSQCPPMEMLGGGIAPQVTACTFGWFWPTWDLPRL